MAPEPRAPPGIVIICLHGDEVGNELRMGESVMRSCHVNTVAEHR